MSAGTAKAINTGLTNTHSHGHTALALRLLVGFDKTIWYQHRLTHCPQMEEGTLLTLSNMDRLQTYLDTGGTNGHKVQSS